MDEYWLIPFANLIDIAFLILIVGLTSRQRREGRAFLVLAFLFAVETLCELVLLKGQPWATPLFWIKLEVTVRLFSLPAFLWFIQGMAGRVNLRIRVSMALLTFIATGQLLLTLTSDAVLGQVSPLMAGPSARPGPLFPLYVTLLVVVNLYGVLLLMQSYRRSVSPFRRRAIGWIAVGMSLWLAGAILPALAMQQFSQVAPVWLTGILTGFKFVCFTYALVVVEQQRLRHLREKEQAKYRALSEIVRVSANAESDTELLRQVAQIVRAIMQAKTAGIYFLPGEAPWSGVVAGATSSGTAIPNHLRQAARTLTHTALESGQPVVLNDLARSLKFTSEPTTALACCLILIKERPVGSIVLLGKTKGQDLPDGGFTEEDVELLQTLASQVGLAVENAMLHEARVSNLRDRMRLQNLGQEEERKRISRELHDGPAQTLAAAVTLAKVAQQFLNSDGAQAQQLLGTMTEHVKNSLDEIRRISRDLRPSMLDHLGLIPTVQWYVDSLARESGPAVTLNVSGNPPAIPSSTELAIFRLIQEALTNVKKHARASAAEVELRLDEDDIQITVTDNGRGFSVEAGKPESTRGGLGLTGMQERIELLGGTFVLKSAPGSGTMIWARVPLHVTERREDDDAVEVH